MTTCRVCNSGLQPLMSFGDMPIANGFLAEDEFKSEYFFEMKVAFCENCGMFQLLEQPSPEAMFHSSYAFYSSTSNYMQIHFGEYANLVNDRFLRDRDDPFVVELGSNDGIMLKHFKERGYRHLGIEPSSNVADVARAQGIETISEFFGEDLAGRLINEHGHADVVLAANVMCHIPTINDVAAGIARLLADDGVLMFEDPYLGAMIEKTSYDQIYDEHVFIFSATSIKNAFASHGMELIDLLPQSTHGGSMRYVLAKQGRYEVSGSVAEILAKEKAQGLDKLATYERFKANCEKSRDDLVGMLRKLKAEGQRVVGYGATSKSTTILNYCNIGPELIEYISDTTPIKQGKFTPGAHIPVKPYSVFCDDPPAYTLLFAWNHAQEIFDKEVEYRENGGKWLTYVPDVHIIE